MFDKFAIAFLIETNLQSSKIHTRTFLHANHIYENHI